jgi:glucose/arabinose dehydrogenase
MKRIVEASIAAALAAVANAQSCSTPSYPAPSLADGYVAHLVTSDLNDPRGIKFDNNGALLVVESGHGVTALNLDHSNGCITVKSKATVVADEQLNHGIEVSSNGNYLYASSSEAAYRWQYDAGKQSVSDRETLITNMMNSDHTTRTLLLSKFAPEMLVVSRGSTSNIDPLAENVDTGHAQVKAFNLSSMNGAYDFVSEGALLAWGVRNDVGLDEDPITGRVYSVENSVDEMHRNGQDIHETNPAEELNFLGYLNGTPSSNEGRNFGYPECYTAWDVDTIPDFNGEVGEQFAIGNVGGNNTDTMCNEAHRQAARLGFHPHMAPLDILFNDAGTAAWVTFHGKR